MNIHDELLKQLHNATLLIVCKKTCDPEAYERVGCRNCPLDMYLKRMENAVLHSVREE